MRRSAWAFSLAASLLIAGSQQALSASEPPPPGYRPALSSDEAGLWMQSDQFERALQQSPLVIQDEALNAYVKKVVCDLAGAQCASIRVYVVNDPEFNAFVMPNGTTVVQSGLLLRVENEAQLAFVLGHELTHYFKRHSLNRLQSTRDTAGALAIFSIAAAGAGVGAAGTLASVIAAGALTSYTRDQEREADDGGFSLATGRGYDPRQGSVIWAHVEEEEAANPKRTKPLRFYSSHPTNKERLGTMKKRADEMEVQTHAADLGTEAFRAATASLRASWLDQELNRGQFDESVSLFQRLIKNEPAAGELQFYLAEAYRRRNGKDDNANALSAYRAAIAGMNAPVAAQRGLGLVALKSGQKIVAREAFQQYLALVPDASDRATVEYYLKTLGE